MKNMKENYKRNQHQQHCLILIVLIKLMDLILKARIKKLKEKVWDLVISIIWEIQIYLIILIRNNNIKYN